MSSSTPLCGIGIDERVLRLVRLGVAAVRADDLHVDAVAAVLDELADALHLVAVAGAVGVAPAEIEEILRVAGPADEDVPAAVPLQPLGMLRVDDDLPGKRLVPAPA